MIDVELVEQLRSVARDVLTGAPGWSDVAALGWVGLGISEEAGGSGGTLAEAAAVQGELGRATSSLPLLGSFVATTALLTLPAGCGCGGLLADMAGGERRAAIALPPGDDRTPGFRMTGNRVSGTVEVVPDAPGADDILVLADAGGTTVLAHLDPASPGLEVTDRHLLDETRRFGCIHAEAANAIDVWELPDEGSVFDAASLAVAADALGAAKAALDATVAYVAARHQFGRPVGSFQAVKHICADMLVRVRMSGELLDAAVEAAVAGRRGPEVAMAAAYIGEAAVSVTGAAIQMHGGIGYTWEAGVHRWLKRAMLDRALYGSPATHRLAVSAAWV